MTVFVSHSRTVPSWQRTVTFTSNTSGGFQQNDTLDLLASLGRPASEIEITTGTGDQIVFTLNDSNIIYPINLSADRMAGWPDLQDPREFRDYNATQYTVGSSDVVVFGGPINKIRIISLSLSVSISIQCR